MAYQLTKSLDETNEQYFKRVYDYKRLYSPKFSFQQMADLIADETGVVNDRRTWAKKDHSYCEGFNTQGEQQPIELMKELLVESQKEKYKASDERTQARAYMRRISREETLMEIGKLVAEAMSAKKILSTNTPPVETDSDKEAIIQISDWHLGIEVNNFVNVFNPEICVQRVQKLLDEVKSYLSRNPVKKIYLVNLGDLIAGRIHTTIRLESRYDVITQCIQASEILFEFINELTSIAPVEYYDCLDNHSRLEPIKADSLDLESLARIIPWHLKYRFENNANVNINHNIVDDDIIAFSAMDGKWTIGGVHGHKDKPGRVVDSLTMVTKINFDMILTAHLHHFNADEKNETLVVSNGSLMGTDKYAMDLRLTSKPSQNIILVSDKTPMEDIHRVVLI